VEVFISHAHEDREIAQRLVRVVELGLQVPDDAIRCTSVPGYDFTPGTDFNQALKDELTGASCWKIWPNSPNISLDFSAFLAYLVRSNHARPPNPALNRAWALN
jgi:hypothetical protein